MASAAVPGTRWPETLLLVGCGNMGGAMLAGWLAFGIPAKRFTILDPSLATAPPGVRLVRGPAGLAGHSFDALLLAVKPQLLTDVADQVATLVSARTVMLSILAGTELATLARLFPNATAIVRIMPNLAAAIGRSAIALVANGLDEGQHAAVTALMQPLGAPEWIDEAKFHAVTALAGSGPAFVYRYIDALARGGVALGLDQAQAERLALAMVEGAAMLAAASSDNPGDLAQKVASPGGTTRAGLDVLDADAALDGLVEATLAAAARRSNQLAEAARD